MVNLSKELIGELQILTSALLFGFAFVGSRQATTDPAGPFTFNAWRFALSSLIIYVFRTPLKSLLQSDINSKNAEKEPEDVAIMMRVKALFPNSLSEKTFDLYFWGIMCGFANFSLTTFIQYGLLTVPAGKAAFINGLFVVVTPFAELLLPGAKYHISYKIWISVVLSAVGTYFLSGAQSISIGWGEILLLCGTFATVANILAADAGSKRVDCVDLTVVEFTTSFILSTIPSLILESHMWAYPFTAFRTGWKMILFVAVVEGGAFLISTVGQMYSTSSARSALIFSLEAVFTVILGYLILNESLTRWEIFGCTLMFIATVISSGTLDEGTSEVMDSETEQKMYLEDGIVDDARTENDDVVKMATSQTPLVSVSNTGVTSNKRNSYGTNNQ